MCLGIGLKDNFLRRLFSVFFLSSNQKILYKYFKSDKTKGSVKDKILVQCVEGGFYFSIFGTIVNEIKKKKNIHVEQYIVRSFSVGGSLNFIQLMKSFLFNNRLRDTKWIKLYEAYCDGVAYRNDSNKLGIALNTFFRAYQVYKNIKSKENLLALSIENVEVGDLIYDTYLRFKPAPTVNINNIYLFFIIWKAYQNIVTIKNYFEQNKPSILLTSYTTYIQHGLTTRIALDYGTEVYSFGNAQSFAKHLGKNDLYHTANFKNYKQEFLKFSNHLELFKLSRIALENRLSGHIDTATAYMKESAYKANNAEVPDIEGAIVVFLHDFFDSPHIYGNMIFFDFLEWIEFTIEKLEENNISYFLKPHPNQIGDSKKVIETLKIQYPKAQFISPKVTNRRLVDAGMVVGVSVYGTVAHELVYMGVPVILCGENPHSSYNFCHEAKTKEEYGLLLESYKTLKLIENAKEEVESFYYMHNANKSEGMKELLVTIMQLRNFDFLHHKNREYEPLLGKIRQNNEFKKFLDELVSINSIK